MMTDEENRFTSEIKISEICLVTNHSTEINFTLSKCDVYKVYNLSAVMLVCFSTVRLHPVAFCTVIKPVYLYVQ